MSESIQKVEEYINKDGSRFVVKQTVDVETGKVLEEERTEYPAVTAVSGPEKQVLDATVPEQASPVLGTSSTQPHSSSQKYRPILGDDDDEFENCCCFCHRKFCLWSTAVVILADLIVGLGYFFGMSANEEHIQCQNKECSSYTSTTGNCDYNRCILIDSKSECESYSQCEWVGDKLFLLPTLAIVVSLTLVLMGVSSCVYCCVRANKRNCLGEEEAPSVTQSSSGM